MKKSSYLFIAILFLAIATPIHYLQAQNVSSENQTKEMTIFPNPAVSEQDLNIEIPVQYQQTVSFYIYDFAGHMIEKSVKNPVSFGQQSYKFTTKIQAKGMYFVQILIEEENTKIKTSKVKKFYVI